MTLKNISFRFIFLYFILSVAPWTWFYFVPGISFILGFYYRVEEVNVIFLNKSLFHIKDNLNLDGGGSGDTTYAWAQVCSVLVLSAIGCLIWSILDRKRKDYHKLNFWLGNIVRYYVALVAFSYGIIKLFSLQMSFPNLSQLATPLGDFLPMRLAWMFIGYSSPYQVFSGVMEILVGLLLLYRKTVTFGALLSIGVFFNVFMLNISYDVPVKLFSMQMVICCIYLAARDWKRILNFFVKNKPASQSTLYDIQFTKLWQKILHFFLKAAFIVCFIIIPFINARKLYFDISQKRDVAPITSGIYSIKTFTKNNDTISISYDNDLMWKDFIFDKDGAGSISTTDTIFRQRYRRGYFYYEPDTIKQMISFRSSQAATEELFNMNYKIIDDKTIGLWGVIHDDSLYFELLRSDRHFQLTEKQFHWVSEANR